MHHTLKYPYKWGKNVVNRFVESSPRGYYFLARLLDIEPGMLRHWMILILCRGHSVRFEALKRVVKILDDYDDAWITRLSPAEKKDIYTYVKYLAEDDEIDARIRRNAVDRLNQMNLPF